MKDFGFLFLEGIEEFLGKGVICFILNFFKSLVWLLVVWRKRRRVKDGRLFRRLRGYLRERLW